MPTSVISSKGQTVIPKEIRTFLGLQTGDKIDFVQQQEDGTVLIKPATCDIASLKGILHKPGRKTVSVEEMKKAVKFRKAVL